MIKAVVFDAYGTLISTGTGSLDAAQKKEAPDDTEAGDRNSV